jgi:hypothetical protein
MGTGIMAVRVMVRIEGVGQDGYMASRWAWSGVRVRIRLCPEMGPVGRNIFTVGSVVTVGWWAMPS